MKLFHYVFAGLLALKLALLSSMSYADVGVWKEEKVIRQGVASIYIGTRVDDGVKYRAQFVVRPEISDISKHLARGYIASLAVTGAVNALMDGIDWVMDPANNRAISKQGIYCYHSLNKCFKTYEEAVKHAQSEEIGWVVAKYTFLGCHVLPYYGHIDCDFIKDGDGRGIRYAYGGKEVSFNQISARLLGQAEQGDEESEKYLGQVADEIVTQQEKERQWEATKHIVASANANEDTDTSNPDKEPKNNDCKNKISDWELKQNGFDAHDLKSIVGSNVQRYELCKCKNKEIVIREKGCKGGIIPTGEFLK